MKDELSKVQKLLVAALELKRDGHEPVTAEALTIAAWKRWPQAFGMRGFREHYPCTNQTFTNLMGERGLPARGWLIKVGQKLYKLSRHGLAEAERLTSTENPPAVIRRDLARIQVPKDVEKKLLAVFYTQAFRRYAAGLRREITFRDACQFWELTDAMRGREVDDRLALVADALRAVADVIVGESIQLSNGMVVGRSLVDDLTQMHQWLMDEFATSLRRQREGSFRRIG